MATNSSLQPAFFNTDADFRNWGSNISAQLAAMGLVQTGDTGQINWTTVLKPAASSTSQGYEIWRFDDSLQSTKPIYIKVEYGAASGGATTPGMWITVGTGGTNGAGTMSGPAVGTRKALAPASNKTAGATLTTYVSGTSGRIAVDTNHDPASPNFQLLFLVDRTRGSDGVATGDGVVCCMYSSSGGLQYQVVLFGGAAPLSTQANGVPAISMDTAHSASSAVGSDLAFSPWLVALGKWFYPLALSYKAADLADLVPVTFTYLGGSHTFLPLGAGIAASIWVQASVAGSAILFPWE